MKKLCEVCKSEFDVRPSRAEHRKTCSTKCSGVLKSLKGTVKVKCHSCGIEVSVRNSVFQNTKSGNFFCSNACVGKFNSKNRLHNLKKTCLICNEEFTTTEGRYEKHVVCSLNCHALWQSQYRTGENSGNFRGGGGEKTCRNCCKTYSVKYKSQLDKQMYCSTECKQQYWIKHTLHNEEFKKAHFKGNQEYRENHTGETKPERMVREYLEEKGLVRDVDYIQEKGFFRKYFADFFIPKHMIIIEVYGDFWHGNPAVYGEGLKELYASQIDRMQKDKVKESDFIKFGFQYFAIWESDIYENIEEAMKNIKIQ